MTNKVQEAIKVFMDRKNRISHPSGKFDNGMRWYPSKEEVCSCCNSIRSPSRSYPYSLLTHCRTAEHVSNLYKVDLKELRKGYNSQPSICKSRLGKVSKKCEKCLNRFQCWV